MLIDARAPRPTLHPPPRRHQIFRHRREVCYRYLFNHAAIQSCTPAEYKALEQSFWQDIEDGIYRPALSLDEFQDYQLDTADGEEDLSPGDFQGNVESCSEDMYYEHYREEYAAWVQSHLKDDYRFVADRIGVDTTDIFSGATDSHIFYVITEVEA